jgi:hypothetical protein
LSWKGQELIAIEEGPTDDRQPVFLHDGYGFVQLIVMRITREGELIGATDTVGRVIAGLAVEALGEGG